MRIGVAKEELRGGIPSRGKQYVKGCVVRRDYSMFKDLKRGSISASSIVCQYRIPVPGILSALRI